MNKLLYAITIISLITAGYFCYQNSNQEEIPKIANEQVGTINFSASQNSITASTEAKQTGGVAFKKFRLTVPSE